MFELAVVVIDFPEQLDAIEFERAEIVLAVRVVVSREVREVADRCDRTVDKVIAVIGDAGGDDKFVFGKSSTDEWMRPKGVIEYADLLAGDNERERLVYVVICRHGRMLMRLVRAQGELAARLLLSAPGKDR